jgi:hypothetical protein
MCQICCDLHETIKIEYPYQYHQIINQIKTMIQEGVLVLIEGNCDFYQIDKDKPFPCDYLNHIFKCKGCLQKFSLNIETYHGSGGKWEVINH